MRRPLPENFEASGQDSFLDVVTNIVGILIILVMAVGLRAKNAPFIVSSKSDSASESADSAPKSPSPAAVVAAQPAPAAPLEKTSDEKDPLADVKRTGVAIGNDIRQIALEARTIEQELELRTAQRHHLSQMIGAGEAQLEAQRKELDPAGQLEFDVRRYLAGLKAQLDALVQEQLRWDSTSGPAVEVKSLPTPISRTVFGRETHFLLTRGRIARVPIEELFERARSELRHKNATLQELLESTETVGPVGGFFMKFTLEAQRANDTQVSIRSKQWQAIPAVDDIGEPVATALADRSDFRTTLAMFDPRVTTITVWIHPDSFGHFRQLKAELYRLGFPTAGRPLPADMHVAGSGSGTKSAAQ